MEEFREYLRRQASARTVTQYGCYTLGDVLATLGSAGNLGPLGSPRGRCCV